MFILSLAKPGRDRNSLNIRGVRTHRSRATHTCIFLQSSIIHLHLSIYLFLRLSFLHYLPTKRWTKRFRKSLGKKEKKTRIRHLTTLPWGHLYIFFLIKNFYHKKKCATSFSNFTSFEEGNWCIKKTMLIRSLPGKQSANYKNFSDQRFGRCMRFATREGKFSASMFRNRALVDKRAPLPKILNPHLGKIIPITLM